MVERKKVAALILMLLGFTPLVYAALSGNFSDTTWTIGTMKADTYYVGDSTKIADVGGLYQNGVALPDYLTSLGVGTTVTQASPYTYIVFKSGPTYFANSTAGTTNYSGTNFATMLNAAIAAQPAGTTYFIKKGTYTLTKELYATKGVNLIGESSDSTIIICGAGYTASNHIVHFDVTVATVPVTIRDITFDGDQGTGQTTNAQGLWLEGIDVTVQNCKVMDPYATGIEVLVDDLGVDSVKILDNTILRCGLGGAGVGPGIKCDHRGGSTAIIKNILIDGNYVEDGGEHGIKCYDAVANNTEIIGNTVLSVAKAGIWSQAGGTIAHNVVRETGGNGIVIGDTAVGDTITCDGNYIYSCGGVESAFRGGIYVNTASPYTVISNNFIYDSFEHGIQFGSDNSIITGNVIKTAGGTGIIMLSGADNNLIIGNQILTTTQWSDSGSGNVRRSNIGVADS